MIYDYRDNNMPIKTMVHKYHCDQSTIGRNMRRLKLRRNVPCKP